MSRRSDSGASRRRRRSRREKPPFQAIRMFLSKRRRTIQAFLRALSKTHPGARLLISAVLLFILFLTMNWIYHAMSKPTEVFFPLEKSLTKSLPATWREYGSLFREHATDVITPELLAALAQAEGNGNPVARTYWRRQWSWNPFDWYKPASSAVGMFQMTDGTFHRATRYCIHDHRVVKDGPWHDLHSCWFNSLYTRILPSHAIEMTAALLDRDVAQIIGDRRRATLKEKQALAALIHLCGSRAGRDFAVRKFRLQPHQRCGDHDAQTYLARIEVLKQRFTALGETK